MNHPPAHVTLARVAHCLDMVRLYLNDDRPTEAYRELAEAKRLVEKLQEVLKS